MEGIVVADKPLYEGSNANVPIGATVEIIENKDGIVKSTKKHHSFKIVDESNSDKFIKGKLYEPTIIDGVTTYLVITNEGNRYKIHSNINEYYFKLQPTPRQGGKRKTRRRKTRHNKKSIIKTKTLRKRV
jgi:hypothetical protein